MKNNFNEKMRAVIAFPVGALLALLAAGCGTTGPVFDRVVDPEHAFQSGILRRPELEESSGLARSLCGPGRYWTHNDSGDAPKLYATDESGADLGAFLLVGAHAVDWEDMTSAVIDQENVLLVGDMGDNDRTRGEYFLYGAREPCALPGSGGEGLLPVLIRVAFVYPDGPHDCEALGVDPVTKDIYLVTKAMLGSCAVYRLASEDWLQAGDRPLEVERMAKLSISRVTSMDFSPDGTRAVVLTYGDAYEYVRAPNDSWKDAFQRPARRIVLPKRRQGEAVCYDSQGRHLVLSSEQQPAPVWTVGLE
jgi:hypothetical protein